MAPPSQGEDKSQSTGSRTRSRALIVGLGAPSEELIAHLEHLDISARGVRHPSDAFQVASRWAPDIIFVEATLEQPKASELIAQLREQGSWQLIIFGNHPTGDLMALGDRLGADNILFLPPKPSTLRRL